MSDTPRTDAELRRPELDTGMHNGLSDLTRQLERELAAANATLSQIRDAAAMFDWLEANEVAVDYMYGRVVLGWNDGEYDQSAEAGTLSAAVRKAWEGEDE